MVKRLLARRGLGDGDDEGGALDAWADEAPVLAGLAAASVQGTVALGPHSGARLRRLGDPPESAEAPAPDGCHARAKGFGLHAGLVVPAGHRERLEPHASSNSLTLSASAAGVNGFMMKVASEVTSTVSDV